MFYLCEFASYEVEFLLSKDIKKKISSISIQVRLFGSLKYKRFVLYIMVVFENPLFVLLLRRALFGHLLLLVCCLTRHQVDPSQVLDRARL